MAGSQDAARRIVSRFAYPVLSRIQQMSNGNGPESDRRSSQEIAARLVLGWHFGYQVNSYWVTGYWVTGYWGNRYWGIMLLGFSCLVFLNMRYMRLSILDSFCKLSSFSPGSLNLDSPHRERI